MKTILLLSSFAALLIASSCVKKNDINNVPGVKVKTFTSQFGTSVTKDSFYYNIDGTLSSFSSVTNGTINYVYTYTYTSAAVVENRYDSAQTLKQSKVYHLGSDGLTDSAIATAYPSSIVNYYKYIYDAEHHLITMRQWNTGALRGVSTYNYMNGNKISYQYADGVGNVLDQQNSTYDLAIANTLGNKNFGRPYLGVLSVNMASSMIDSQNNTSTAYYYTYTVDSRSLVSSWNETGGNVSATSYTYY